MSSPPPPNIQAVHNICNSVAWSILFNISVFLSLFKFSRVAAWMHMILGFIILLLTLFAILWLLIQYSFNLSVAEVGGLLFAHGILGLCMIGFAIIQVAGGLFAKLYSVDKRANLKAVRWIKRCHMAFGYFMGLLYKINILWSWYAVPLPLVTYILIAW